MRNVLMVVLFVVVVGGISYARVRGLEAAKKAGLSARRRWLHKGPR